MRIAQKHRPTGLLRKGAKVTVRSQMLHGTVEDVHVSYRVARSHTDGGEVHIVVGENEDVDLSGEAPLATHVSYLVHRVWDNTDIWVPAEEVEEGHIFKPAPHLVGG